MKNISRRRLMQLTGSAGSLLFFARPLKLLAAITAPVLRDELGIVPNEAAATGFRAELLNIAQVSDVHITNVEGPLRLENLKWLGVKDANLDLLDSVIDSVKRDQSDLSCQTWDEVIRSINSHHEQSPMDFVISTGDHTDTDTEEELTLFVEIADGIKSPTFESLEESGAIREDFTPEGLRVPWYATIGNHDVEYIGTFNSQGLLFGILAPLFGALPLMKKLSSKNETIEKYSTSNESPGPYWHGFDNQPYQNYRDWQGYYSFSPKPYIHCIVLNTANFNSYDPAVSGLWSWEELPRETFSLGVLDKTQYEWMVQEIEDNQDKLCLIFSHHSAAPEDGSGKTSFMDPMSDIKAAKFRKTLCQYPNVIAHINGHSHVNAITPVKAVDGAGGYWNINTCAIIEWPMEWRNISVRDNGDGTGSLVCRMIRHGNSEILDVAGNDPAATKEEREGGEKDRDVELVFAMTGDVSTAILENPPSREAMLDGGEATGRENGDMRCFIATAAYGTPMAAEVMSLRRFRDSALKPHLPGRLLVALYYRLSPAVAAWISPRPALRAAVRGLLEPVIRFLRWRGY